jgi:hypothetical protein
MKQKKRKPNKEAWRATAAKIKAQNKINNLFKKLKWRFE